MTTHEIELPQGYAERPFDYSGDLYTEGQVRAIIEADRKRRGEPNYFTYVINGNHRGISETEPPDDSYDEGTLQRLFTTPQPLSESDIPAK